MKYVEKETRFVPLKLLKAGHRLENNSDIWSTGFCRPGTAFFECALMIKIQAGKLCRMLETRY